MTNHLDDTVDLFYSYLFCAYILKLINFRYFSKGMKKYHMINFYVKKPLKIHHLSHFDQSAWHFIEPFEFKNSYLKRKI